MKTDSFWTYAAPIIKFVLILVAGRILLNYFIRLLDKLLAQTEMDKSLARFLKKAVKIVGYIVLLMTALSAIGVSISGMLAVLSGCAVAIGVGLKDSLGNVAGGILLLVSPRFATGDYIAVGSDEGSVLEVDLLHTIIRTPDGKQVSIPNGSLVNSHITNYTAEKTRRVEIILPIPYEADADIALAAAREVLLRHPLILSEPDAPFARIGAYADSAVQLTLRAWCNTADYWPLYYDLLEQTRAALRAKNIEIPFNRLDVHIRN